MDIVTDLVLMGALAVAWTAAGLVADGLQNARSAAELRRRSGWLSALVVIGAAVFVAVPAVLWIRPGEQQAPSAALLAAIPALVALTVGVRRLGPVRRGAGAFATAPQTPLPPALRAAAAHPLIIVPLQVTGLAAIIGLPIAAHVVEIPASNVAGIAITVVGVAVLAIGIRAAVRHSRLSLLALAPIGRGRPRVPVSPR
ncbi:hypothetical protein GCM10010172_54200 [Paractinoplanes ferrugineus]|uniref:Uncharacterized protein n=1 Tax=Paractinoplanes ferrugineus TaxID=113564 RepID=A0A919ML16_9ACTN|nr:hypothetical protein [Actinoplanes ferrugineus]GIE11762.1 hypothetical protein Afe05nite_36020 [Actinoplanes ferrugineus]